MLIVCGSVHLQKLRLRGSLYPRSRSPKYAEQMGGSPRDTVMRIGRSQAVGPEVWRVRDLLRHRFPGAGQQNPNPAASDGTISWCGVSSVK